MNAIIERLRTSDLQLGTEGRRARQLAAVERYYNGGKLSYDDAVQVLRAVADERLIGGSFRMKGTDNVIVVDGLALDEVYDVVAYYHDHADHSGPRVQRTFDVLGSLIPDPRGNTTYERVRKAEVWEPDLPLVPPMDTVTRVS